MRIKIRKVVRRRTNTHTVQHGIERQILPKVAHPARTMRLAHTLVDDDLLHPLHRRGVCEVQHGELDTQGVHQIRAVVGVLYKVAVGYAFAEEVMSEGRGAVGVGAGVGEERGHVGQYACAATAPQRDHIVPACNKKNK